MSGQMPKPTQCRTCAQNNAGKDFIALKEVGAEDGKTLAEMLMHVANINAMYSLHSSLPKQLCVSCVQQLKSCYSFVLQAQLVNLEFMKKLKLDCLLEAPIDVPPNADNYEDDEETLEAKIDIKPLLQHGYADEEQRSKELAPMNMVQVKMECNEFDEYEDTAVDNYCSADSDDDNVPLSKVANNNSSSNIVLEELGMERVRCEHCLEKFISKRELRKHMLIHNQKPTPPKDKDKEKVKTKPFQCKTCGECFNWRQSLRRHMKLHIGVANAYHCELCERSFGRKDHLTQHMRMHSREKNGLRLRKPKQNPWNYVERLYTPQRPKLIICKLCEQQFERIRALQQHMQQHQDVQTLQSLTAESDIVKLLLPADSKLTLEELRTQIATDIKEQRSTKYYAIVNNFGYELHIEDSDSDVDILLSNYKCEICNGSFSRKHLLFQHTREQHKTEKFKHTCNGCRVKFVNTELFKYHVRAHCRNKDRKLECGKCPGRFVWQKHLDEHSCSNISKRTTVKLPIYNDDAGDEDTERIVYCQVCYRSFNRERDLKRHMETHGGIELVKSLSNPNGCKLIECMICQSKHVKFADLRTHLYLHQNNISFAPHAGAVAELSTLLYPELPAMSEQQLEERIAAEIASNDLERFYSITNEAGFELSLSASETDSDTDAADTDDEDVADDAEKAVKIKKEKTVTNTINDDTKELIEKYTCDLCEMHFKRKYELFSHCIKQHNWHDARHVCVDCNARFVSTELLQWHLHDNCKNTLKKHQCNKCPRKFMWMKNLKMHNELVHVAKAEERKKELAKRPRRQRVYAQDTEKLCKSVALEKVAPLDIHCFWCPRKFSRKHHLHLHLQKHGITPEQYEHADCIRRATTTSNGPKDINCKVCNQHFDTIAALRMHLLLYHNSDNSEANYCITNSLGFEMLLSESETEAEMDTQQHSFKYACLMCMFGCVRRYEIAQHQLAVHQYEQLPLKCDRCTFNTVSRELLNHHTMTQCHNSQKKYSCPICDYKFMWQDNVAQHIKLVHTREHQENAKITQTNTTAADGMQDPEAKPLFKCNYCTCVYRRKQRLVAHVKFKHPIALGNSTEPEKKHLCSYCGLAFINNSVLNIHMRRHTGEKPFKCDFCEKAFHRSSELKCHRRTHTGERPYKCTLCDKGFLTLYKLRVHFRKHSGTKPYQCTYCDKSFYQPIELTVHVRMHTGERPYSCTHCDKTFKRAGDLALHMRQHTGICPFVCGVCNEGFISGTLLKNHRLANGHYENAATATMPIDNSNSSL